MSLFKVRDWWHTKPQSEVEAEEFDKGCMCIANIDNDPRGNVKIITGSFYGFLRIYNPTKKEAQPEDLLLEQQLNAPILQIAAGKFFSNSTNLGLAVLHPRKLVVYCVITTPGNAEQGSYSSLERRYEHALERTSANLCFGPFGGVVDRDFICVQSMDGVCSFFEQESPAFSRYLVNFLLPGPLCFVQKIDSFVTANTQLEVECYKYSNLAAAASDRAQEMNEGLSAKKRLQTEWSVNLGELTLDIAVARYNRALPVGQVDIICLTEHSLFCVKENGSIRTQKRLDYHPACLAIYAVDDGNNNNIFHNLIIGTHDAGVKIYKDNALIWSAGLAFIPVALSVATIADIPGMVVTMDDTGQLIVSYLGTDPATNVVNVQSENKEFNYDDMDEELKRLQLVIREATTSAKIEPTDVLELSIDESSLNPDTSNSQTTVKILLKGAGTETIENITLSINIPEPITTDEISIVVPLLEPAKGALQYPLNFYIKPTILPSTLLATVIAAYTTNKGEPRTAQLDLPLPLSLVCKLVPTIKASSFKITIDTNKPALQLSTLYQDMQTSGSEQASVISFKYINGQDATILVSKNAGRYRIQSSTSFEAMWLISQDLTERLTKRFSQEKEPLKLSYSEDVPFSDYFSIIETHFGRRLAQNELRSQLNQRAQQFRTIQKRLLARFKDKNAAPLHNMDVLLEGTNQQLNTIADNAMKNEVLLREAANSLSCATQLMLLIIRYKCNLDDANFSYLVSYLSPIVDDGSDQSWEDSTLASLEHVLRTTLANSPSDAATIPTIRTSEDTSKLRKLIEIVVQRLTKGGKLYKPPSKKTKESAKKQ